MKGHEHLASMLLTEIQQLCSQQHCYLANFIPYRKLPCALHRNNQKVNKTEKIKPSKEDMAEEMSNAEQFHREPEKD